MSQADTRSLQTLLEHAEAARDRALQAVQQAQAQAQLTQRQADQLLAYRGEYRQRWATEFARGGSMPIVQCYQAFMQRLDEAIAQQRQVAERAWSRVERGQQDLLERELRVASVRKIVERRVGQQQLHATRRDQKQSDEAAMRAGSSGHPLRAAHGALTSMS